MAAPCLAAEFVIFTLSSTSGLTFAQWAASDLLDPGATPTGDHDNDGYDYATEFALGLYPPCSPTPASWKPATPAPPASPLTAKSASTSPSPRSAGMALACPCSSFARDRIPANTVSLKALPRCVSCPPAVSAAIEAQEAKVQGFAGVHLEGPHLSITRQGAHDPKLIRVMSNQDLYALLSAKQNLTTLLTTVGKAAYLTEIFTLIKQGLVIGK